MEDIKIAKKIMCSGEVRLPISRIPEVYQLFKKHNIGVTFDQPIDDDEATKFIYIILDHKLYPANKISAFRKIACEISNMDRFCTSELLLSDFHYEEPIEGAPSVTINITDGKVKENKFSMKT